MDIQRFLLNSEREFAEFSGMLDKFTVDIDKIKDTLFSKNLKVEILLIKKHRDR